MSDDPSKLKRDRRRIALEQEHEVRYWTEALGVSREELEEAVRNAGSSAEAVREHLASKGKGS